MAFRHIGTEQRVSLPPTRSIPLKATLRLAFRPPVGAAVSEPDIKRCTRCDETKPLVAFYLKRVTEPTDPRRSHCKTRDAVASHKP